MSAGYGRGYYGDGQLQRAPCRPRRGWVTALVVIGVGAAAWLLWPRKKYVELPPQSPSPAPSSGEELAQLARDRGFSSTQAFEDSVVATARELRKSGARVHLSPSLQHLESRIEG